MKWAAIVLALFLALALAKTVLTILGFALVLAVVCALILRPRQTLLLAGEVGLFCLALAYPWAAIATAVVVMGGLALLKRQAGRDSLARLRPPPAA